MIEAKGKRSERNGGLRKKKFERIVCISDCHGFSFNSIWTSLQLQSGFSFYVAFIFSLIFLSFKKG